MIKAAAYLRVSTEGQVGEDKFGLADQRSTIEAYACSQDFEIVAWYSDEGISGATLEREGLQALLRGAAADEFNAVLVAKMDRIARDLMAQLWIEKELMRCNVELISAAEPFRGQDPANVLFRQIIGAFAQFEKARIAERLRGGRKQKAKTGGYSGGAAAIGYKNEKGSKFLDLDNEKAETVKRVFEIKEQYPNWSLQTIADQLNAEGHTTAKGTNFKKMQVKRTLDRREFYAGNYSYAGIKANGQHKAIINLR